jgi:hypothetical protein
MKNIIKKSSIAAVFAFALTASMFSSNPAVATTLDDLQGVTTFDQTTFDAAIRLTATTLPAAAGGEMDTLYTAALSGNIPTLTLSAAVILQSGTATNNNFAFIDQTATPDTTAVPTATSAFNYAAIDQSTANNNAYILQNGDQNYASIVQGGTQATVAYISQLGNSNRAIINQK